MLSGRRESYHFDEFTLDRARGVLRTNAGIDLPLRPKAFATLLFFVQNAGRLIDRDELMQAIWPGVVVTEDSIAQCILEIRRVLGGDAQRILRTVQRRGYRFDTTVTGPENSIPDTSKVADTATGPDTAPARPVAPLTHSAGTPRVAVLPFQNMSDDPDQEYFADGMVEEIITTLSRIRWLSVIARNSSFIYKGQAVDITRVGKELGVRYVLEGSVRRSGSRVRVTAQLIDAENGAHLWAERFDGPLDDVFELQDRIATAVAGVMEPTLQAAEGRRAAFRPTHDMTAYDLYLHGYAIALSSAARFREARDLMEQAIARDPNYGLALSFASICCFRLIFDGNSTDPEADARASVNYARRSLVAAGDDPTVLAHAANVLMYFGEDTETMFSLVDRALALSPSYARGWYISGTMRIWAGETDVGIRHVERALELSPGVRVGWVISVIGIAHFLRGRFEEALPRFLLAIQEDRTYPDPYRFLAATYAHLGREAEAGETIRRLREYTSVVIPSATHLRIPEQRELFLSGLARAVAAAG